MVDPKAADAKRRSDQAQNDEPTELPPAGPHAKPELTDKDKTPGSGVLPDADEKQTEAPTG